MVDRLEYFMKEIPDGSICIFKATAFKEPWALPDVSLGAISNEYKNVGILIGEWDECDFGPGWDIRDEDDNRVMVLKSSTKVGIITISSEIDLMLEAAESLILDLSRRLFMPKEKKCSRDLDDIGLDNILASPKLEPVEGVSKLRVFHAKN